MPRYEYRHPLKPAGRAIGDRGDHRELNPVTASTGRPVALVGMGSGVRSSEAPDQDAPAANPTAVPPTTTANVTPTATATSACRRSGGRSARAAMLRVSRVTVSA